MLIEIDPIHDSFLRDHVVNGAPLLSTVMGLDVMVRAALLEVPGTVAEVRAVTVGPPIRFLTDEPRALAVYTAVGPSDTVHCHLVDRAERSVVHFSAEVVVTANAKPQPVAATEQRPADAFTLRARDVYPPYFHGPVFQVVGGATADGDGLVALLAQSSVEPRWAAEPLATAPLLLELCLQACGLFDLATTGRMMIPHSIEQVDSYVGVSRGAQAFVRRRSTSDVEHSVFDGEVVGADGRLLLRVEGYRTVDLGWAADPAAAARVRAGLGFRPVVVR